MHVQQFIQIVIIELFILAKGWKEFPCLSTETGNFIKLMECCIVPMKRNEAGLPVQI